MFSADYWEKTNSIVLLDPAIATPNSGDNIISQAAVREMLDIFPEHFFSNIPTHEVLGTRSYRLVRQSQHAVLAGSNILTEDMIKDRGWRYRLQDSVFVKDIITLAVGWRSYRGGNYPVGRRLLKRALHSEALHSVRDEYTKQRLEETGIPNVVNTGCVTMWRLDIPRLAALPKKLGKNVIFTINARNTSDQDQHMVNTLCEMYENVYAWPQGIFDRPYCDELLKGRGKSIGQSLGAYDAFLRETEDLDYVGHRLHGGIRALQHNVRALVVAIDNRAAEIGRDTNLPIVMRDKIADTLRTRLENPDDINITLPQTEIDRWRDQFKTLRVSQ